MEGDRQGRTSGLVVLPSPFPKSDKPVWEKEMLVLEIIITLVLERPSPPALIESFRTLLLSGIFRMTAR